MEYNSSRPFLSIPEYGRNVQKMVDHALTITDREERTNAANIIVGVMAQTTTQPKDVSDFKHKLWNHLFVISNFGLDVDAPYPIPEQEEIHVHPEQIPYSSNDIKFKHYGKTLEKLIEKAISYPEGEEKDVLVFVIANHMKKAYVQWNKGFCNDELIYGQLNMIAKGKLVIDYTKKLHNVVEPAPQVNTGMQSKKRSNGGGGSHNPRNNNPRNNNNNNTNRKFSFKKKQG